jgi:hypothetical protein
MDQLKGKGVEINGKVYLSRLEVREVYGLSHNKCQRLFEKCELEFITRYNRNLYEAGEVTTYFNSKLEK